MAIDLTKPDLDNWIKLLNTYDPAYYQPGKKVTAEEWNTLFLAGVNQGNYLSETIQLLIDDHKLINSIVGTAKEDSAQAKKTSAEALSKVQAALDTSQNALDKVNTAVSAAEQALNNSTEASANASTALETANSANNTATQAITQSTTAANLATQAQQNANAAVNLSTNANNYAQTANTNAAEAHRIASDTYEYVNNRLQSVQADYAETDITSPSYIKNKPIIPSIDGLASVAYVDKKVADLVNSAPETLDTLGELATAISNNEDVVTALNSAIGNKANKNEVNTKGGLYRGTFDIWDLVPTDINGYNQDDNGNTTPLQNDYIVLNNGSGKLDDSSFIYQPNTTGGGASIANTYNGVTQTVVYYNATGSSNAKTLNNVVSVYYNSNTGKWVVTTLVDCVFNNTSYSANDIIAEWGYSSYHEGHIKYSENAENGGILVYNGVWDTNGKEGWNTMLSINNMSYSTLNSIKANMTAIEHLNTNKADKVTEAIANHIASLDADGNLQDSGTAKVSLVLKDGINTMSGTYVITGTPRVKSSSQDVTTNPSSTQYKYIDFYDKNNSRVGLVGSQQRSDGYFGMYFQAENKASLGVLTNTTDSKLIASPLSKTVTNSGATKSYLTEALTSAGTLKIYHGTFTPSKGYCTITFAVPFTTASTISAFGIVRSCPDTTAASSVRVSAISTTSITFFCNRIKGTSSAVDDVNHSYLIMGY